MNWLLAIATFYLALWFVVAFLAARISGWAALVDVYRLSTPFNGKHWRVWHAELRYGSSYGFSNVGANPQGLYLAVNKLLPCHPPLLIPWTDVSISLTKGRWHTPWTLRFRRTHWEFRFRRVSGVYVRLTEKDGRQLTELAGSTGKALRPRS
ncbi:MAG: hypothetical protein HY692_00780 [Cyanobacteria bacterium NC_groundwater_1444_Ag_S-0.65um_54_12]|nr:hypothetical protein [Cyanobacteria bacterium NC_groundwater_1444_Ag_S-0.65um_54_12]